MILRLLLLLLVFSKSLGLQAQNFYKTLSGAKYHLAACRMVKNVSEKVSPQEIIELGLGPCKICHPEVISRASSEQKDRREEVKQFNAWGRQKLETDVST